MQTLRVTYRVSDGKIFSVPTIVSIGIFAFKFTGSSRDGADFLMNFTGVPGGNYLLQFKDDLSVTNWITIGAVNETSPGNFIYRDIAPTNQSRFYRAVLP